MCVQTAQLRYRFKTVLLVNVAECDVRLVQLKKLAGLATNTLEDAVQRVELTEMPLCNARRVTTSLVDVVWYPTKIPVWIVCEISKLGNTRATPTTRETLREADERTTDLVVDNNSTNLYFYLLSVV